MRVRTEEVRHNLAGTKRARVVAAHSLNDLFLRDAATLTFYGYGKKKKSFLFRMKRFQYLFEIIKTKPI
jgi:hypothetical protein